MSNPVAAKTPWFAEGLRFECVRGCRRCCGGAPGVVHVTDAELLELAAWLHVPVAEFEESCVRRLWNGKASLRERPNGDCVLLDAHGCSAYAARPKQCRDYPFWPEVLATRAAWDAEQARCPGIGRGRLHTASELAQVLATQEDHGGRTGRGQSPA